MLERSWRTSGSSGENTDEIRIYQKSDQVRFSRMCRKFDQALFPSSGV